jgi:hypothetical protein
LLAAGKFLAENANRTTKVPRGIVHESLPAPDWQNAYSRILVVIVSELRRRRAF